MSYFETMEKDLERLQDTIGYKFSNHALLIEALTHKSWGSPNNERLEFLGDSVLELAISHLLYQSLPEATEGELSKIRSWLVSEDSLAEIAGKVSLGEFLRLGKGEKNSGGRRKPSILASALEALLAAVYLDGGFEKALELVRRLFGSQIGKKGWRNEDYKTQLQEYTQAIFREVPVYLLLSEQGPEHSKTFEVAVLVRGKIWGRGKGKSKKEAEQRAAEEALRMIRHDG